MAIGGNINYPQLSNLSYTQQRERQRPSSMQSNDVVLKGLDEQAPMPVDLSLKGVLDAPEGNVERASRVCEA